MFKIIYVIAQLPSPTQRGESIGFLFRWAFSLFSIPAGVFVATLMLAGHLLYGPAQYMTEKQNNSLSMITIAATIVAAGVWIGSGMHHASFWPQFLCNLGVWGGGFVAFAIVDHIRTRNLMK